MTTWSRSPSPTQYHVHFIVPGRSTEELFGKHCWRGLGGLREVRYRFIQADPWLGTGGPDVEHRPEHGLIIQGREADGHESVCRITAREERRAATRAEAADRKASAATTDSMGGRYTRDCQLGGQYDDAGREGRPTGALAVTTVAVDHCHRRTRTDIANRSACTAAGEWSSHDSSHACQRDGLAAAGEERRDRRRLDLSVGHHGPMAQDPCRLGTVAR
jgi:hypothetical protein